MRPNILLCCSGSVATIKIPEIVVSLHHWANVFVVCSSTAKHFLERAEGYDPLIYQQFLAINESQEIILTDSHEWFLS
jgi:phosphopantothenoylcysteine decarboxylase